MLFFTSFSIIIGDFPYWLFLCVHLTRREYLIYSVFAMIQSMTGFGSAEKGGCRIDIRSLNHRYLDVNVKAPVQFAEQEIACRNALRERFARGKIDVGIAMKPEAGADLAVNVEVARKIHDALRNVQLQLAIPGEISMDVIARLHDLFMTSDARYDADLIAEVFSAAVDSLEKMRIREGAALADAVTVMIDSMSGSVSELRVAAAPSVQAIAGKFSERLASLTADRGVEEARVLQEAAIMAVRYDVTEEIERLASHITQFRETLSGGGAVGRKLDFIVQEMNREINTIASKSPEVSVVKLTVEMKSVMEKIREQVQNIQ